MKITALVCTYTSTISLILSMLPNVMGHPMTPDSAFEEWKTAKTVREEAAAAGSAVAKKWQALDFAHGRRYPVDIVGSEATGPGSAESDLLETQSLATGQVTLSAPSVSSSSFSSSSESDNQDDSPLEHQSPLPLRGIREISL